MNPVEIADAVSELVERPFDAAEFPFQFLTAFGNKKTTIDRLRKGSTNQSDVAGGVLQRSNIHIATCAAGATADTLSALRESPKTASQKAKFILSTDGEHIHVEDLSSGELIVCEYEDLVEHFGVLLPLAGVTTVPQIKDSTIDIRATGKLNKLYTKLREDNPDWENRREDMNHFMARLIFCFFAEDTDIFHPSYKFTETVTTMSGGGADNTAEVIQELFRAMNTPIADRKTAGIKSWADGFPYVNGELFSGSIDVPYFSGTSRGYLTHIGGLDWTRINPDIFGSMIQAVADDEERGALGMHYTSVPNILKVLNPLFLDDLRAKLEEAGDNGRKLANLRNRMAKIRVFDPACGSGNFLVIAYKQMREIEAEINCRRSEPDRKTDIPSTNFRGIELRDFPAEIARLALIIAEYQCDVLYRGQKEALAEFLPLDSENWITCGNALRLDWLSVCPPTGTSVKVRADDLFETPLDQSEIDFENAGGETYICGNPPYKGSKWQSDAQKADLAKAWSKHRQLARKTDFVSGWIARFLEYAHVVPGTVAAFVTTNSICQGQQASDIWPVAYISDIEIRFAHTPFKWQNLASHNAGVTVIIVGLGRKSKKPKFLFDDAGMVRECNVIGPYLVPDQNGVVRKSNLPIGPQSTMLFGNMPRDGGHLFLTSEEAKRLADDASSRRFVRRFVGSEELINGKLRYCLWIEDDDVEAAHEIPFIKDRLSKVAQNRGQSPAVSTREFAKRPHRFVQIAGRAENAAIVVPRVSSENRDYLPVDYLADNYVIGDRNFALYDAPLWNLAVIASRLHWVWIGTVCVRMRTDFSYSNTLGWNTFPLPSLTERQMADLTRSAERILLAREAHYPATISDLYAAGEMPDDLKRAHEQNDEVVERIFFGKKIPNDTERLERLFASYDAAESRGDESL
ncbi:DNA methyltransferase [Erythrobacter sp. F6033]|uniref:class I SAM-dependent DNA methyltransferase n=1 Tax=Erythrobacter sp. F6033 TaxID=2926401 RepID=UPI001FF18CF8|nr:DNA methyltransferase [Erythrobacter sp. F6033]MCK0129234.1 N-6 DNA methylase [Erythrobacter sp. F6033]